MFYKDDYFTLSPDQKYRVDRARKLCIQYIDKENQTGLINDYHVNLLKCSCQDFKRQKNPCKHMYRLAYELGLCEFEHPVIPVPYQEICSRTVKSMIKELLTHDERKILFEIARNSTYEKTFVVCNDNSHIVKLLDYGFADESFKIEEIFNFFTKTEILKFLSSRNLIFKNIKNYKKSDILIYLTSNYTFDELKKLLPFYVLCLSKKFIPHAREIYSFLRNDFYL